MVSSYRANIRYMVRIAWRGVRNEEDLDSNPVSRLNLQRSFREHEDQFKMHQKMPMHTARGPGRAWRTWNEVLLARLGVRRDGQSKAEISA